ncbi:hypothetical protein D3C79_694250 [compost metagenome]
MDAAYADAAPTPVSHVQGIDDLEADQAGTQPECPEQFANMFVAGTLVVAVVDFYCQGLPRFSLGAVGDRCLLLVIHVKAPFRGQSRYRQNCCLHPIRRMSVAKLQYPGKKIIEPLR